MADDFIFIEKFENSSLQNDGQENSSVSTPNPFYADGSAYGIQINFGFGFNITAAISDGINHGDSESQAYQAAISQIEAAAATAITTGVISESDYTNLDDVLTAGEDAITASYENLPDAQTEMAALDSSLTSTTNFESTAESILDTFIDTPVTGVIERWLAKFEHRLKWNFCLNSANMPRNRRDDDEAHPP